MSVSPVSWWTFADPDREGGWAYVVYDGDGHPHYGTAPTQVEAASRARKLTEELGERQDDEAAALVALPDLPICAHCGEKFVRPSCVDGTREAALGRGWREEDARLMCTDCAWMLSGPVPVAA